MDGIQQRFLKYKIYSKLDLKKIFLIFINI